MSHRGKSHVVIMFTVGPDDVAEGDQRHIALAGMPFIHSPWLANYESPAGIAWHWQDGMDNWADMSAAMAWSAKGTVATLHNGTAVQALW